MSVLDGDVGFLLSRASGLVVRAGNLALAEQGMRVRQYSALSLVAGSPDGLSQRELASALGLDPSQVVLLVDDLEADGLVERRPSPTDRRTRLVVVTPQGEVVRRRASRRVRGALREELRVLTDGELDVLTALLAKVVAAAGEGIAGRQ